VIVLTRRKVGDKRFETETLEFSTFKMAKAAAFGYKHTSLRCDSCQALVIQGTFCHETGCPEAWRDSTVECAECGCDFSPLERRQKMCDDCLVDGPVYWR
jgi:hypothetical protein